MRIGDIDWQKLKRAIVKSLCLLLVPTISCAQTIANQNIVDRPRPDYDALGVGIGGFTLYPAVTARIDATDNYRATSTNTQADVYLTLQPELRIQSRWARHSVEARVYASPGFHSLAGENATELGATADGTYDISHDTSVRADLTAARFVESRAALGAFRGTASPVRYNLFRGGVGLSQTVADLTLNATATAERRDYGVAAQVGAGIIDQTYRNVDLTTVGGSAQYALRNGLGLIVSTQFNRARYDFHPGSAGFVPGVDLDRASHGFRLLGGVSLELSRLVFGTIQVGYLRQTYADPRLVKSGGLSYNADVLWNVTQLTSVRIRGSRSIEDTSSTEIAGYTRSDFRVTVDHEWYRYILVNAEVGFSSFRPNGTGSGGREFTGSAGARYLVDRRISFLGNIRYSSRASDDALLRYRAVSLGLGVRFAI